LRKEYKDKRFLSKSVQGYTGLQRTLN